MENFGIIALAVYGIALIVWALYMARERKAIEFLSASKKLGAISSAFTIFASKVGGGLILTYSALTFLYGWSAIILFLGFIFGYILFFLFAQKLHDATRDPSVIGMVGYYQKFAQTHSEEVRIKLIVGLIAALSMFGWVITNLIGGGVLLSHVSGLSFNSAVALIAVVVGLYTGLSGFLAVVRTDAVQAIAIFVLFIIILGYLVLEVPSSAILQGNLSYDRPMMPYFQMGVFFVIGALFPFGSAELWERVIATESKTAVRRSLILASICYVIFGWIMTLLCLAISQELGVVDPNRGLFQGFLSLLPPAVAVLALIAFASAILSSADTFIFSTSSLLAQAFSRADDQDPDRWTKARYYSILVTIVGAALAVSLKDIVDVTMIFVGITLVLATMLAAASLIPNPVPAISLGRAGIIGTASVIVSAFWLGIGPVIVFAGVACTIIYIIFTLTIYKIYSMRK